MKTIILVLVCVVLAIGATVARAESCIPGEPCILRPDKYYLPLAYQNYTYGRATVTGRIVDEFGLPMETGVVRLAQVYCNESGECATALDVAFSPAGWVTANGVFVISDVYPTRYVIAYGTGDIDQGYQIICDETMVPRVWTLQAGKVMDVGVLAVWRDGRDNTDILFRLD